MSPCYFHPKDELGLGKMRPHSQTSPQNYCHAILLKALQDKPSGGFLVGLGVGVGQGLGKGQGQGLGVHSWLPDSCELVHNGVLQVRVVCALFSVLGDGANSCRDDHIAEACLDRKTVEASQALGEQGQELHYEVGMTRDREIAALVHALDVVEPRHGLVEGGAHADDAKPYRQLDDLAEPEQLMPQIGEVILARRYETVPAIVQAAFAFARGMVNNI